MDDAAARGATLVAVEIASEHGWLAVTARDDGSARHRKLLQLADRIGALGGTIDATPTVIRAKVPCA